MNCSLLKLNCSNLSETCIFLKCMFYTYGYFACMLYLCAMSMYCPWKSKEVTSRCWELNPYSLENQPLLTTERPLTTSLAPQVFNSKSYLDKSREDILIKRMMSLAQNVKWFCKYKGKWKFHFSSRTNLRVRVKKKR